MLAWPIAKRRNFLQFQRVFYFGAIFLHNGYIKGRLRRSGEHVVKYNGTIQSHTFSDPRDMFEYSKRFQMGLAI